VRSFREILEDKKTEDDNIDWTKQDLIELIQEQDLDDDDIAEITELIIEIVEYGDFDWNSYDWN
jgi:hypothetical protein